MMNKLCALAAFLLILLPACAFAQVAQFELSSRISEHHRDKIGEGAKEEVKTKEGLSTVTLAPGKISVRSGDSEKIYDFSKNIITYIDHAKKQFVETSLYAIPAFKDFERRNREMLAKAMQSANVPALQTDPFEMETIFGDNPATEAAKKVQISEDKGSHKFIYNAEEVASYSLSDQAVKDELKDSYKKYLIYEQRIHPVIYEDLGSKGIFFSALSYRNKQEIPFLTESSFTASAFKDLPSDPIVVPEGYQKNYAPDERLDKIIKLSMTEKEKTVDDYLSEMNSLLDQKQYLDASLVFHEYATHTGGKDIERLKETVQRIFSGAPPESGVQELTNAVRQQPSSKEQLQKAIEILEAARAKGLNHGYILNVFLANYLNMAGQTEKARDLILEALEKNPFLAGAYKDLGDKYLRSFDMANAWASWDQMRRLSPDHQLAPAINGLEQQIRQKHPVYFQ